MYSVLSNRPEYNEYSHLTIEEGLDLEDGHFEGETPYGINEDVFKCYVSQVVEVLLSIMADFGCDHTVA